MGAPGTFFPPGSEEKIAAAAEGRDFYPELSDEERAAEGLPPRETPKEESKPVERPAADPDEREGREAAGGSDRDATARFSDEIAQLRHDLAEALADTGEPPEAETEDHFLSAALEHDDPVVRGLAERLQSAEKQLKANDAVVREERVERQLAKDAADFDAVRANYAIDGRPVTDADIEAVENYILEHPTVGRELTIEAITRVVHPGAVKVGTKPAAKGPGRPTAIEGGPVATIVDEGASGGAPPQPWKPGPNTNIEAAVRAAGERFGWTNR